VLLHRPKFRPSFNVQSIFIIPISNLDFVSIFVFILYLFMFL